MKGCLSVVADCKEICDLCYKTHTDYLKGLLNLYQKQLREAPAMIEHLEKEIAERENND